MTDIPTSDAEIAASCPGITIWMYKDIAGLRALPRLPIAILYETEPGYGHWVAVLKTPEGIEHFDSYGLKPDAELKFIPEQYKQAFNATSPHLVRLLAEDGRPVNYNEFKLQGSGKIATCGRWVVARCRNSGLTTRGFARAMSDLARSRGVSLDEATLLVMPPRDE